MTNKINYLSFVFLLCFSFFLQAAETFNSYSINLFHNNKKPNTDKDWIFPNNTCKANVNTIVEWAIKNPRATICLWYDSLDSTSESVAATRLLIQELITAKKENENSKNLGSIELRDMRELAGVKNNPQIFSFAFCYLRFDFGRVIAAEEMIQKKKKEPFIFANLNLPPLDEHELIDEKTIYLAKKFGLFMNMVSGSYENNFFIRYNNGDKMTAAVQEWLIERTIEYVKVFFDYVRKPTDNLPLYLSQEVVYKLYPATFMKFFELEGMLSLTKPSSIETEEYPLFLPKKMYREFVYTSSTIEPYDSLLTFNEEAIKNNDGIISANYGTIFIPCKQVPCASVSGNYPQASSKDKKIIAIAKDLQKDL